MKSRFFLGAYWDARHDSLGECTKSVSRLLNGMAVIDLTLSHWYERSRSRKDALARAVDGDELSQLEALLLKGRNRYDEGGGVIEELGYSLGLWNGAASDEGEASLKVHCGCSDNRIGNSVLLDLPMASQNLGDATSASSLLALVAKIWRPRWAGIMSKRAMAERDFDADRPFVDWMIYVPRAVQSVPPSANIVPIEGLGSIIIVQAQPPSGNDPEELNRIRQVDAAVSTLKCTTRLR